MKRILFVLFTVAIILLCGCTNNKTTQERVKIAIPESPSLTDAQTNYYRLWLEEQTGIIIEFELVAPHYIDEYLRLLAAGGRSDIDAMFFGPDAFISAKQAEEYGRQGFFMSLDEMITEESSLESIFTSFNDYDFRKVITGEDGHIYYMPNLNYSESLRSGQTLWVNASWLSKTNTTIPATTEEFRDMLVTFKENDPNNDGKYTDIPLASCFGSTGNNVIWFLMNAFVYTDPANVFMAVDDSRVYFAPASEEWRNGLIYCKSLYQDGLLAQHCFSFEERQFVRLVCDSRDMTGAFTASSVADVLTPGSPNLYSRFIYVPPLEGSGGTAYSLVHTTLPKPGGVIFADSENKNTAFKLMDFMLSEEAYLVAAFGQQGVDWNSAAESDVGYDGKPAKISVKSNKWNQKENRHFSQSGPFFSYTDYGDGVAWNGFQADQRYLNARAARVYREHEPEQYLHMLILDDELRQIKKQVEARVNESIIEFVTGRKDPADDAAWHEYLNSFDKAGLEELIEAAQQSYIDTAKEGK